MWQQGIDDTVRRIAAPGSRREAIVAAVVAVFAAGGPRASAKNRPSNTTVLDRRRKRAQNRSDDSKNKKSGRTKDSGKKSKGIFSKNCKRFVISAGPDPNDKFQHIDDDVMIELIPKGKNGTPKVLLHDDNNAPNGPNGDHLSAAPFTAKVGDSIHVVARNEVVGGCELDEIWIHCTEGQGGKVKLLDAVTPEECRSNASKVGVFSDETVRISNK